MKTTRSSILALILLTAAITRGEVGITPARSTPAAAEPAAMRIIDDVEIDGGAYRFTIDTTETPDLTEWSRRELTPVMRKWYPLIVTMLPSKGFAAPKSFSITFTDKFKGVAATMDTRIVCDPGWYRSQLKGEAIGSLVHELVHVVQQYGRSQNPGATRPPGWLVEGLADYIRWYLYEPQSKGCEISPRQAATARHDASYRVTANFLNHIICKYDRNLIKELNTVMRDGHYDAQFWKTHTGEPVDNLAEEWKKCLEAGTATP